MNRSLLCGLGLISLLLCGCVSGKACLPKPDLDTQRISTASWTPSGTFTLGYQENLYKPRFNAVVNEDPVVLGDLVINLPSGFYLETWRSFGTDDNKWNSNKGDELSVFLGWKEKFCGLDIKTNLNYANAEPLNLVDNDVIAESLSVSKNFLVGECGGIHHLRIEARADYVSPLDLDEGAWIYLPGVHHTWQAPFTVQGVIFSEQITFQHNDDFGKFERGTALQWSGGLSWKLTERITLNAPTLFIGIPLTDSGRDEFHSLGLSMSFSF